MLLQYLISNTNVQKDTRKAIVFGAHPGDPEAGCGGLIALLSGAGHDVVVAYLTRGEAGVEGTSHSAAAAIRTEEAQKACDELHARIYFVGQLDGDTIADKEWFTKIHDFIAAENPDLIITHWPMDTHFDHRICGSLVYDAWLHVSKRPALYFYEIEPGRQTQNFIPTEYVNISSVSKQKKKACYYHESQKMKDLYDSEFSKLEEFRGWESGYELAEAYAGHSRNPKIALQH